MAHEDPRLLNVARTVNDKLLDDAIRHATLLARTSAAEQNRMVKFLQSRVLPRILDAIQRELRKVSRGKRVTTRLRRLQRSAVIIGQTIRGAMSPLRAQLKKDLLALGRNEIKSQIKFLGKNIPSPIAVSFDAPGARVLGQILGGANPYQGRTYAEWMDSLSQRTARRVNDVLKIGLIEGQSITQIVNAIRGSGGVFEETRRNLEAIVRTSVTHVTARAREATYAANDDLIKGVQYVATLDARTTVICASLDGRVFPIDEGPRPPQHINCRSTTVPVLKSARELGIPAKDLTPSTRASMNGQVAGDVKYGEWLRGQTNAVQVEALGATRAQLFRQGKIDVNSLVNQRNRPLTLEQIQRREGLTDKDLELK